MQSPRPEDWPEWVDRQDHGSGDAPGPGERESAYELLQRGQALLRDRHHAQAATVLARAARLEPGKGSILEALGRAYYNSGQHKRSAETFAALIEVDPSAHYAHYALGQSLKQLGELRGARTHLRLACALSPTSPLYRGALDRLPVPAETTDRGAANPRDGGAAADQRDSGAAADGGAADPRDGGAAADQRDSGAAADGDA